MMIASPFSQHAHPCRCFRAEAWSPISHMSPVNQHSMFTSSVRTKTVVEAAPHLLALAAVKHRALVVCCCSKTAPEKYIERRNAILKRVCLDPKDYPIDPESIMEEKNPSKTGKRTKGSGSRQIHKLLQVLSGSARRTKLISPDGMSVRPMMQVVKGAAFDILQVAGGRPAILQPGRWLDLYCGTGSVGIEAMSRGCTQVHFVEVDPWVVSKILQPNLEITRFSDRSVIHTLRVGDFLKRAQQIVGGVFEYISVTPPYKEVTYEVLMRQIANSGLVGDDTFIVVEYPLERAVLYSCGPLLKMTDRRFGRTRLVIYGPEWATKKRDAT